MAAPTQDNCLPEPGPLRPVIDPNRCEGKEDCLRACPYDVFVFRAVTPEEKSRMSVIGRLKLFAHGGKQAFVANGAACHSCGLCVTACPEKAIKLARAP